MNYQLAQDKNNPLEINNFQYISIPKNETFNIKKGIYPLLFILKGKIILHFSSMSNTLSEGHLFMLNSCKLTRITIVENTVVLIYLPPQKLTSYFKKCSSVFNKSISSPVYFNAQLQEWIAEVKKELEKNQALCPDTSYQYCQKLASILMEYSQNELEELYIPFLACSRCCCNQSNTPLCCDSIKKMP